MTGVQTCALPICLVFTILAALAQFERELTGERTKSSLAHKKRVGEAYSPTPFGYDRVEDGTEMEKKRLVANVQELSVVESMRHMKSRGVSLRGIAAELNKQGVKPKRGQRWYASSVKSVLETDQGMARVG